MSPTILKLEPWQIREVSCAPGSWYIPDKRSLSYSCLTTHNGEDDEVQAIWSTVSEQTLPTRELWGDVTCEIGAWCRLSLPGPSLIDHNSKEEKEQIRPVFPSHISDNSMASEQTVHAHKPGDDVRSQVGRELLLALSHVHYLAFWLPVFFWLS
jgi:hypothetical protein